MFRNTIKSHGNTVKLPAIFEVNENGHSTELQSAQCYQENSFKYSKYFDIYRGVFDGLNQKTKEEIDLLDVALCLVMKLFIQTVVLKHPDSVQLELAVRMANAIITAVIKRVQEVIEDDLNHVESKNPLPLPYIRYSLFSAKNITSFNNEINQLENHSFSPR